MDATSTRQQLTQVFEQELAITEKLLAAYPRDQSELRPHDRAKNARELTGVFSLELGFGAAAIQGTMDLSGGFPPPPDSLDAGIEAFHGARAAFLEALRGSTDEQLGGTVTFFTAPYTTGDVPVVDFLWFMLHDHIHHRGQFSVYLRMSGAKVPSIYGPSADEPWF